MRAWAVALLFVPLAGCLTLFDDPVQERAVHPADPGFDPEAITVTSVKHHEATIESWDGTPLSALVYEPSSPDALPNGTAPRWPVVVFVHGLGSDKESFQSLAIGADPPADVLERFAQDGFLAVAYDTRGFGRSGGQVSIAGPAEQADLRQVISHVIDAYPTTGRVGITGGSYGGGHSFLGWAQDDRVVTAAPMHGWLDLAEAVVPGHVPKMAWMNFLFGLGVAGSGAQHHPMMAEWYQSAYTRAQEPESLHETEAQLAQRGIMDRVAAVEKPLFVCQGMQESLFVQAHLAWEQAPGFTRGYVGPGGHGVQDPVCWDRVQDWFRFFLKGVDTQVDTWPALETVDARDNDRQVAYDDLPSVSFRNYALREPDLAEPVPSNATFTIEQRFVGNPLDVPAGLSDVLGTPPQQVPGQFTDDPQGVFFHSKSLERSAVLIGAPRLTLVLQENGAAPFQVAATLYVEGEDGARTALGRSAAAALGPEDVADGTIEVVLPWIKADLRPGERLVLEVAANDLTFWLPLLSDYSVAFTGASQLHLPLYAS